MTSILRGMMTLVLLALAFPLGAQEPASEAAADAAKQFQAYAKEAAGEYELRAAAADGRKLVLAPEPVLRWSNPLGGRKAHGDVFLWTDEGRPAAVLSIYEFTAPNGPVHEHHEFCSLATEKLVGDGPENRDWSPAEAGVTFARLADAPPPAASPTRRLSQIRELAERFSASKITREDQTKRGLRLLTKPVLRYESKQHAVTDGALFALVEATDPEIFLMIEARPHEDTLQWHYALARMNSLWLAAAYADREVWQADVLPWREILNRTEKTYMIFLVK